MTHLRESYLLNFVLSVVSHHYFLLIVLSLTFASTETWAATLLLPMTGKSIAFNILRTRVPQRSGAPDLQSPFSQESAKEEVNTGHEGRPRDSPRLRERVRLLASYAVHAEEQADNNLRVLVPVFVHRSRVHNGPEPAAFETIRLAQFQASCVYPALWIGHGLSLPSERGCQAVRWL